MITTSKGTGFFISNLIHIQETIQLFKTLLFQEPLRPVMKKIPQLLQNSTLWRISTSYWWNSIIVYSKSYGDFLFTQTAKN